MSSKRETVYLHGYIYWPKIFGAPRKNYEDTGREWRFEFEPDAESVAKLTERGVGDRVRLGKKRDGTFRKNYEDRAPFMDLKRDEFDYEKNLNDPIRVVDAANQPWNDKTLLGNRTEVDVKVNIVDYGAGKFKGIYPQAIRVLELAPYVSEEFEPLPQDDPRVRAVKTKTDDFRKDFGLEEDEEAPTSETQPQTEQPKEVQANSDLDDDVPL